MDHVIVIKDLSPSYNTFSVIFVVSLFISIASLIVVKRTDKSVFLFNTIFKII